MKSYLGDYKFEQEQYPKLNQHQDEEEHDPPATFSTFSATEFGQLSILYFTIRVLNCVATVFSSDLDKAIVHTR